MLHVIVKLWPGKSQEQKTRLAEAIANDVMKILNYGEESVSVAFGEVSAAEWAEKVYKPISSMGRVGSTKSPATPCNPRQGRTSESEHQSKRFEALHKRPGGIFHGQRAR